MIPPSLAAPASQNGPDLRDIHLPAAPPWWPPAPGWWVVAILVLALLGALAWMWRYRLRLSRERRRIMAEVEAGRLQHARDADDARLAGTLHQLLRRVARIHDPAASRQQGDAWQATLERVPVDADTVRQLMILEQAMYRADVSFDAPLALAAVRSWLRHALRPRQWKPARNAHA